MKTAFAIVAVIIIGAVGYFLYAPLPAPIPVTETETSENAAPPQAKININAVCDGALAYMTFSSGAEAEAFVEACKRGEHPEVVEQWKEMNGYNDGRAI